jgi:hypothetical protein
VLLLSRVKRHVKQELEHLPAYTCLETVQRSTNHAGKRKGLAPLDTVRLEILYTGNRELYASPGAQDFQEQDPSSYTSGGLMGNGVFASHLQTVFISESALFTYRGDDNVARDRGWAHAVKYDFRIPLSLSGWTITVGTARGLVASRGSFWVDPDSLDLLRMDIYADDIPPILPVNEVSLSLVYGRMRIGSEDIMLPQSAEMRLAEMGGTESVDEFDFTHCRSYQVESSITFSASEALSPPREYVTAPPARRPTATAMLPAGLMVPVILTTALTGDSAVGTLLEGRIPNDVSLKGRVIIPAGSVIRGRLRRLEHHTDSGGYFVTGLEFTEVDAGESALRFYADLQNASGAPGFDWLVSTGGTRATKFGIENTTENIRITDLPGVGSFFIRGSRFSLPAGFKMQWKTRALE